VRALSTVAWAYARAKAPAPGLLAAVGAEAVGRGLGAFGAADTATLGARAGPTPSPLSPPQTLFKHGGKGGGGYRHRHRSHLSTQIPPDTSPEDCATPTPAFGIWVSRDC